MSESVKKAPAIERAAQVLDLVAGSPARLTAADLGRQLGLAKSSTHVILTTLADLGLLVRRADQTYALGPHVARWGQAFQRQTDVAQEFARIWDEGTSLPGATITLSVLEGADVVYIGARNSGRTPWVDFRVGMRLPMAYTATGMAFMSCMTRAEILHHLGDTLPAPLTTHSAKSVDEVLTNAEDARTRGYSIDDQQVSLGMKCLGAPVLDVRGHPIAAVAVSIPAEDFDESHAPLAAEIREIARRLSLRMGATG